MRRPVPGLQDGAGAGQVGALSRCTLFQKLPVWTEREDLLLWYLPLRIPLVPPPHRRILHSGPEGKEGSRQCLCRGDL